MERPSPAKKYKWRAPKFFEGQTVRVLNHHRSERVGVVSDIQTRYGWRDGIAYHMYHIRILRPNPAPGEVRFYHLWITEEDILGLAPQ